MLFLSSASLSRAIAEEMSVRVSTELSQNRQTNVRLRFSRAGSVSSEDRLEEHVPKLRLTGQDPRANELAAAI